MAIQTVTVKVSDMITLIEEQKAQWLVEGKAYYAKKNDEIKEYNKQLARVTKPWNAWMDKVREGVASGSLDLVLSAAALSVEYPDLRVEFPDSFPKAPKCPSGEAKELLTWDPKTCYYNSNTVGLGWAYYQRDFDRKLSLLNMIQDEMLTFKLNDFTWGYFFR